MIGNKEYTFVMTILHPFSMGAYLNMMAALTIKLLKLIFSKILQIANKAFNFFKNVCMFIQTIT